MPRGGWHDAPQAVTRGRGTRPAMVMMSSREGASLNFLLPKQGPEEQREVDLALSESDLT